MRAHQRAGVVDIPPLAQEEPEAACLPGAQPDRHLQRGAGIEPRPEALRQYFTAKSRGLRQRAVATEE